MESVRIPKEHYRILKDFMLSLDRAKSKDPEKFKQVFEQFQQGLREILLGSDEEGQELPRILDLE